MLNLAAQHGIKPIWASYRIVDSSISLRVGERDVAEAFVLMIKYEEYVVDSEIS